MEEIDIWRSAALLVRQHGEDAELHVSRHIDAMIERGDPLGEAVWKRVRDAVKWLQGRSAPDEAQRH